MWMGSSRAKRLALAAALALLASELHAVELSLPLPTEGPDADEIARQVYFVNHFYALDEFEIGGSGQARLRIINLPPDGKVSEVRASRYIRHFSSDPAIKTKDMVVFESGTLRSTAILATDFINPNTPMSFSAWLPALRKVRRMGEPPYDDKWGGSLLTYGDIYLRRPEEEKHELQGKVVLEGCLESMDQVQDLEALPAKDCSHEGKTVYLLKSLPKRKDELWYDYRLSWIDPVSFADYKAIYFKDGKEIKSMAKSWRALGQDDPRAQVWEYWYARNADGTHQAIALMPLEGVRVNSDRSEDYWSEATLSKMRR